MKRRRTPQEKKAFEYEKDHATIRESAHGTRKSWPHKEVRTNRAFRRRVRQLIDTFEKRAEKEFPDAAEPAVVRRTHVRKLDVLPLGWLIEQRLADRISRMAGIENSYRRNYDSLRDRERFTRFLESQVGGHTETSAQIALQLHSYLDPRHRPVRHWDDYFWDRRHEWLLGFFRDAPEWEYRVREWIESFEEL